MSNHLFMQVSNKITEQQLELLQSFKYLTNEKQISEVKELLNLYYQHKLDTAIDTAEENNHFTAAVYEAWANAQKPRP